MTLKYFNVKNGLTTGNIILNAGNSNISANTFIGNINVTSSANLGSTSNVIITGGTNGYVLSTDGTGNLSWVAQSGGSASNIAILDEGVTLTNAVSSIDFVGSGVTATANGNAITVTISGGGSGTPGGSNTEVQFNDGNTFAGNAGLTFDKTTTTLTANNFVATSSANLGAVGNVSITGGSNGYVLQTDGTGNLSWVPQSGGSSSSISNGTSNVNISTSGGNITASVAGNANIATVTGTGVNVAGTLNVTGNTTVANLTMGSGTGGSLTGGNLISANFLTGTLTTAAQPNITSLGTLTGLTSNGTINLTNASNVSLGAIGNVKVTGGSNGQYLTTDGAGNLSFTTVSAGPQPGTDFNTSISAVNNYAVTNAMANAAVFGSNVIVYSMYITNIDTTGSNGAAISANLRYSNGTSVNLVNQVPVPYRGAVELFKQPKYFASGDALQLQAFNNGVGANSFFHSSITYQSTTDTSYQYAVTNIATANTATNVYTSTSNASVVQSVMLTNSANLGNIAVTATVVNSSNVVQGYLCSGLLVPVNSTIELCEQPRRMSSGDVIQVTSSGGNTMTVTVSARKI